MPSKNRLKVLHLISGGDTGGAKTHIIALLNGLKEKITIKLITFMDGEFTEDAKASGIDTLVLKQKSRLDLTVIGEIKDIIEKEGYSIVHCHGARANFIGYLVMRKLNKATDCRFVTTIHSDYLLDFKGNFLKNIIFKNINIFSLKKFKYYITVSRYFRDMLVDRGFDKNKIYYVYNGLDFNEERTCIEKEEFLKKYEIEYKPEYVYIGILARIDRVKGHEYFLRAAKIAYEKNKNIRFIIAGLGEDFDKCKQLSKELGIDKVVYFIGFVNKPFDFMNAIDINTLSSLSESFPFVLLEGAVMKKATIAPKVGGISDIIIDGETGLLFNTKDYEKFAENMIILSENEQLRNKYGNNLYNYAAENFSVDSLVKSHIEIYNKILE